MLVGTRQWIERTYLRRRSEQELEDLILGKEQVQQKGEHKENITQASDSDNGSGTALKG